MLTTENATVELVMFALWMENVLEKVWFTVAELKVILKLKVILVSLKTHSRKDGMGIIIMPDI